MNDEFKNENSYGSDIDQTSESQDEYSQSATPDNVSEPVPENSENDVFTNTVSEDGTQTPHQPTPEESTYSTGYDYSTQNNTHNNTPNYSQPQFNQNGTQYTGGQNYNPYSQNNGTYHYSYTNNNANNTNYNNSNSANGHKPTKSGKGKKVLAVILAFFIVIASIGIGTAIGRSTSNSNGGSVTGDGTDGETINSAQVVLDTTKANSSSDLDAVKKARDSVVGIVVYDSSGELAGEGSGVVMGTNDAGTMTYIITCAHVISDDSVKSCGILLEDGTIYEAKIVGYDERTDIGVLSIKETGLQAATFGDSSTLEVTESVYAIGNPGGSSYYGSVTDGIVSAVDRSLTSTYTMQVIQHTAAISPGNSGGALVNSAGQVIGINSSKIAATDYEGIGFAVPIAIAKPVVENLIQHGYVPNRPKLGISYASVTNYQVYSMVVQIKGLPKGSVIIASISDDSSLAGGNVKVGDMITSVNGKDLDSSDVLLDIIDNGKVGDEITLGICRVNSRTYEITTFEVTAKLVEDKGSVTAEEETTENDSMNPFGDSDSSSGYGSYGSDWEDFFRQFFGQ